MSATRDPSQKPTFVYSNMYTLFRKARGEALKARGEVLKVQTKEYRPVEFLAARRPRQSTSSQPIAELKKNLNGLKELQSKLKFLLSELETELAPKKRPAFDSDE